MRLLLLCILATLFSVSSLSAQFASNEDMNANIIELELDNTNNWGILLNEDDKTLYIDFEEFDSQVARITITSTQSNEILVQENAMNLPKDSIYELTMSSFEKGTYKVEIVTFKNVIAQEVKI